MEPTDTLMLSDEQPRVRIGWMATGAPVLTTLNGAPVAAFITSLALGSTGWSVDHPLTPTPSAALDPMTGDGNVLCSGPEIEPLWAALRRYQFGACANDCLIPFRATTSLPAAQIVESQSAPIQPPHLEAIRWMKEATGLSQERIAELLGVSRQTLNRWNRGEPIKDINRRRIFGVRQILELAVNKHPTREQMLAWLDTPQLADGVTPAQALAAGNLDRARLLAVTTPSPHVKRPPAWVRWPVPEAFRAGAEHMQVAMPPEDDSLDIDFQE
ncbi:MAG TPA: helix-turn-helix domain-containing protein [Ktedonobacterales bacterium]|nr:helix-turn-helix domain-containing protein [Ktedonobacterales bacterium]